MWASVRQPQQKLRQRSHNLCLSIGVRGVAAMIMLLASRRDACVEVEVPQRWGVGGPQLHHPTQFGGVRRGEQTR